MIFFRHAVTNRFGNDGTPEYIFPPTWPELEIDVESSRMLSEYRQPIPSNPWTSGVVRLTAEYVSQNQFARRPTFL